MGEAKFEYPATFCSLSVSQKHSQVDLLCDKRLTPCLASRFTGSKEEEIIDTMWTMSQRNFLNLEARHSLEYMQT